MAEREQTDGERDYVLRRQQEWQKHRREVRRLAVLDVAHGKSVISVAAEWGILRSELERWIDEAAVDAPRVAD